VTSTDSIDAKFDALLRQQKQILDAVRDLRSSLLLRSDLQNLTVRTEIGGALAAAEERLEAVFERRIADLEHRVAELERRGSGLPKWED
jgi:hypothetical protein